MPSLGPAGRGGARRRTRRRMGRRQDAASASQPQQQAPAEPAAVASDPMAELKKLGELHDAGVLTDDEFSAKKADILAKM